MYMAYIIIHRMQFMCISLVCWNKHNSKINKKMNSVINFFNAVFTAGSS